MLLNLRAGSGSNCGKQYYGWTMKALLFTDVAKSQITEVKKPAINDDEVLVRVRSCAICGTDIKLDSGASTKLAKHGIKNMPLPRITGHEVAGDIVEVGKNIIDFRVGDRVNVSPTLSCLQCSFCLSGHNEVCDNKLTIGFDFDGGFAEFLKVPAVALKAGCMHKIADELSYDEATFTEPLAVVINSQERSRIEPGCSVLIIGAGPIGILQLQVARINKASRVIISEISGERLDFAKRYDPDVVINPASGDFIEGVLNATENDGVDVVLICASAKPMFSECLKVTRKLGRINYFAGLSKQDSMVYIDANLVHYNEIEITGTSDSTPSQNRMAMELLNSQKVVVRELITHRFSLDEYFDGLAVAKSGKAMKVIINP